MKSWTREYQFYIALKLRTPFCKSYVQGIIYSVVEF